MAGKTDGGLLRPDPGLLDAETQEINYGSNGIPAMGADAMYQAASEKGATSTMPEIPGLGVWHKGHIGIYIGNGEVVEDDFLFGAICNSTSVGGILTLDPKQVDMTDGKLEVLLVRSPQSLLELTECIAAVQSQQYNNCEMITFRSGSKIEITADPEMPWTLDGEREEGHSEVVVTPQHLAYRLMKRQ